MTPEQKEGLDDFGKMLVAEVYDRACEVLHGTISHGMKGIKPDPFHLAYQSLDEKSKEVLRRFVMEAVDQTFAQFLNFLDVHKISIPVKTSSGEVVDVQAVSDGLAAEPYNDWGWIAKYSRFKYGIDTRE
jgi:hypothetical protein